MKRLITILLFIFSMSFPQNVSADSGVKIVIPQKILNNILQYIEVETPNSITPKNKLPAEIVKENTEQNKIIAGFKYVNNSLNTANDFLGDIKGNVSNFISSKKYILGIAGTSYGYIYTKYINPKFFENLVSKTFSKTIDITATTFSTIVKGMLNAIWEKPGATSKVAIATLGSVLMIYGTKLIFTGLTEFIKEIAKNKGQPKKNNNATNNDTNEDKNEKMQIKLVLLKKII